MWSGVSKSGSPAESEITSRPSDFICVAKLDIAIVGEGFTLARLLDSILIYLIRLYNRLNCLKVPP